MSPCHVSTAPLPISSPAKRELTVGEVTADNAHEMRALFGEVFGKPMSEALWNWKYGDGQSKGIGVWDNDRMVGFYGGLAADIVIDGRAEKAVQIADVMVLPSVRNAVRTQSPFFRATSRFIESYVGKGMTFLIGYGFPSDRHLQLARRLGFYESVGGMRELTLVPTARKLADRLLYIEPLTADNLDRCAPQLDSLWLRMQASMPTAILVRKQAAWLQHRYIRHPHNQYRCWLWRHRITGKPYALAVVKLEAERALVMDVVAAATDFADALRLTAIRTAREQTTPIVFWLSSSWQQRLGLDALEAKTLPITTPANVWTDSLPPEELRDRWCLTAGDSDYL